MKTVKLFPNGRSRAVRIPSDWIKGVTEVNMYQEGSRIIIEPKKVSVWDVADYCKNSPVDLERLQQSKTNIRAKF